MNRKSILQNYSYDCKRNFPEFYKELEKGIKEPKGFYNWKDQMLFYTAEYLFVKEGLNSSAYTKERADFYLLAHFLLKDTFQTYFVGKGLIDSLMNSTGDLGAEDMPVKDKSFLFMFPRNKLKTPSGKIIESVACRHIKKEFSLTLTMKKPNKNILYTEGEKDRITSVYQCGNKFIKQNHSHSRDVCLPENDTSPIPMSDDDRGYLGELNSLIFKLYWIATTKPELITKEPPQKGKRETAKWLGRDYKIQREHTSHSSPKLHIRKGHFRSQPCGEGRRQRRIVWLQPCWVGVQKALTAN